ncbi:MAG: orotidine-5'-phosphate decarboxylase [Candidatus Omnitrophota bacterium]
MKTKLIVALDVAGIEEARALLDKLCPVVDIFKVGSQLFTACGPAVVDEVHKRGARAFLDLKFHDIPNTVEGAVRSATRLGVFMLNVHIQGGIRMMQKAKEAAFDESKKSGKPKPIVLGVTVLTSMDQKDLSDIEIRKGVKQQVTYLAKLAKQAGLDGVVASAQEIQAIKWTCGDDFLVVTPGIRPAWAGSDDQRRSTTPAEAVKSGADYMVVGRPILKAEDQAAAAKKIIGEINGQ